MKTFDHPHLPLGAIIDTSTLRTYLDAGQIKISTILDNGELIDNSRILLYLKDNSIDFFIHSDQGFIWWMTRLPDRTLMADRPVELTFYTHDDDHDSDFKLSTEEYDSLTA